MASLVEQRYRSRVRALSSTERVARSMAMLRWTRELLARQVIAECGEMTEERLKWEVGRRLYRSDPLVVKLIGQRLADVPR